MGLFKKSKEDKLHRAGLKIEDAIYEYDKWMFSYNPSRRELERAKIARLIRKFYQLGGDPKDHVSWRYKDLIPEDIE